MRGQTIISRYIADHQKTLVRNLQELIAIPTVNPPGEHYETCVKVLAEMLRSLKMKVQVFRVPWEEQRRLQPLGRDYPRFNVIGRWDVGARKTLHFNAHYDVVPVSGRWKYGPFVPKVSEGWVYGRGSSDMKGSISCFLLALESLRKTGSKPGVNVEVSFTADEETGGQLGAGYIVKKKLIDADYAVVMEGGQKQLVGLGHNGVLWLECLVRGKPAHGATPHLGVNSFEQMNEVAAGLFELREKIKKRKFKIPGRRLDKLATRQLDKLAARQLDKLAARQQMHPTMNIGGVFGVGSGAKVNTVPGEACFTVDRRLVPGETLKSARTEILAVAMKARRKFPELQLEFKTLFESEASLLSPAHSFTKKFSQIIESVHGKKAGFDVCCGFTDLHYFAVDGKIPGLGYGPEGENHHAVDERISVKELVRTAEVYAALMIDCTEE